VHRVSSLHFELGQFLALKYQFSQWIDELTKQYAEEEQKQLTITPHQLHTTYKHYSLWLEQLSQQLKQNYEFLAELIEQENDEELRGDSKEELKEKFKGELW
jgi:phage anti-repressor protein